MARDDLTRLQHMRESATEADIFAHGKSRVDLDHDRMLTQAIIRSLEVIGEAAANVSVECRTQYPQIPWPNIIGMRNRLIHAYFDINLDIVWKAIEKDIPILIVELNKILSDLLND